MGRAHSGRASQIWSAPREDRRQAVTPHRRARPPSPNASPTLLTEAMGINRTSTYAAFGNKEELFRRAVARYAEADMAYAREALAEPTAHEVIESFLRANADALTRADRPSGCLSVQGGLAEGGDSGRIARFLVRIP